MTGEETGTPEAEAPADAAPASSTLRDFWAFRAVRWLVYALLSLLLLLLLFIAFLHTPPGRQFIVDQIGKVAPASGLQIDVGEIEGSILWSATLYDVEFRDANDTLFLEVPTVDLNWRPHKWLFSGLDIRHLVLNDGTLYAAPVLDEGDPDAPILPDFDIRIDRFAIDNLTVAEGLIGEERLVSFAAEADIRDGRVFLDAGGELGGADVFTALIDVQPDGDVFDIAVDYQAPAGGVLAGLVGAEQDLALQVEGDGSWTRWEGDIRALQGGQELIEGQLFNESGEYRLVARINPLAYVEGLTARALGETVMLTATGALESSVATGGFVLRGRGLNADGAGAIDLADNRFEDLVIAAQLLDPQLFSETIALNGASITGTLAGDFGDFTMPHELRVAEIDLAGTIVTNVLQRGTLAYDGTRFTSSLDAAIGRVVSGIELADPRLVDGRVRGNVALAGGTLTSDNLDVQFQRLSAQLGLSSDFNTGVTRVTGPVDMQDLLFDGIGEIDGGAQIRFVIGGGNPWQLQADVSGVVSRVTNATLANLSGGNIRFGGGVRLGEGTPIAFDRFSVVSTKANAILSGDIDGGTTTLAGSGRHVEYGPFTVEAELADDGPRAVLVFADPLPAARLSNVRVALAPTDDGFRIETEGGSLLGAFDGELLLNIARDGTTTFDITRLTVSETQLAGVLTLVEGGVEGNLNVGRGGLDGTIALAVRDGGQGFDIDLAARSARFEGATPLLIHSGTIDAAGVFADGAVSLNGNANLTGLSYGQIFIGRLAARAQVTDNVGRFNAALTGRRGSRFELRVTGDASTERIAVAVDGSYDNRRISMPRRAVFLPLEDGGWELQRSQLSFGNGFVLASGRFGGDLPMQGRLSLVDMPLGLSDVLTGELGVGGTVSGVAEITAGRGSLPTGEARLMIEGLTRSSALLTSEPMDIALVADLSETLFQARAVMDDGNGLDGRLQARIAGLPANGTLTERLYRGNLFAQLRYNGSSAALWRLAAISLLDVTGDVAVAADIRGTLENPRVVGSLAGGGLRVRSGLIGTDLSDVSAAGRFTGSRFNLTRFSGTAPNGGTVSGSGYIDLSNISRTRGPSMDLRIAARRAELLDLPNMGAVITGPMRIISDGRGGTIAGRLTADSARWRLGTAAEAIAELPQVLTRERNVPGDIAPIATTTGRWRYLIDVGAPGGIEVDGLGLDSQWRTDNLEIRGTTADPRLGGTVVVVPRQGFYSFAGRQFAITQGIIRFSAAEALDPQIDLVAETRVDGLAVSVDIVGRASQPQISFTSNPSLPQEELLARLLFGGSISNLSATDALQLGAAVASLRGGAGLDPINQLRSAIGLDRLRLVPADTALGRGTAIALGRNFANRFYVEIITDGAGYSATNAEFRISNWLNLLATVSTIGRHSAALEYRRDY
ncbi:translocation/assembly module TamB domain-containing protein [Erythrobacter sp. EC-HK427]|uniref:translocation/assembly module TamB domain-containing protein n=1 Tax=Erythrobacter sp. EC-HK427 TaxID=2038396 RepID=UPI001256B80C|nr:translocation/assembly module TamB domain-containing protein [Erythrobacter sp. EC-HK427]VVS97792.1 conserved hypothetical protein [Erythrobacter sp. EC-HK427]